MKNLNTQSAKTALITGSSCGVGKEIALILAEKKWNLVLVARSEESLKKLSNEITEKYGVKVLVFPADLSKEESPSEVLDFCRKSGIKTDLLINNAGCGLFGESVELSSSVLPMLKLNILGLTQMCALFGKEMKERKEGSILNIGSIAGNQPTAYFASYAASKSYVLNYSLALRNELKPYKVNVTCVQPGYIRTDFDNKCLIKSEKYKKFSYRNGMSAKAVAKCAVKAVLAKRSYVRSGIANKFAAFFAGLIPKSFLSWCLALSVRNMTKDS